MLRRACHDRLWTAGTSHCVTPAELAVPSVLSTIFEAQLLARALGAAVGRSRRAEHSDGDVGERRVAAVTACPRDGSRSRPVALDCVDAARSLQDARRRRLQKRPLAVASRSLLSDARIALGGASLLAGDRGALSEVTRTIPGIATGDSRGSSAASGKFDGRAHVNGTAESVATDHGVRRSQLRTGRNGCLQWMAATRGLAAPIRPGSRGAGMGSLSSQMGDLPATLYFGRAFDNNTASIVPETPQHLPALWASASQPEFNAAVRQIDQKLKVTNATLAKVPFDLEHWTGRRRAVPERSARAPQRRPDPVAVQGHHLGSEAPLQVAVARLLGYRWPDQEPDALDELADADGIVPLSSVGGERPAAERLRALLARAYGDAWSPALLDRLLAEAGSPERPSRPGCATILRPARQALPQRPFIWHVWDGRKDGFSVLCNYHRLDRATLEKLTYTLLGDWIERQRAAGDEPGAEARLSCRPRPPGEAEAILEASRPTTSTSAGRRLAEQPIGWEPDLDDGVRLNIRPFVTAGILRAKVNVNWNKDRGKNPDGSERINDLHSTLAEKRAAGRRRGERDGSGTFLDALVAALDAARAPRTCRAAPVAILWPDEARQWGPIVAELRGRRLILELGDYDPQNLRGPAYWIRCVVDGRIAVPDPAEPAYRSSICRATPAPRSAPSRRRREAQAPRRTPVPRGDLRPAERPGLDDRGVPPVEERGGLGIEVADDQATKDAMLRARAELAASLSRSCGSGAAARGLLRQPARAGPRPRRPPVARRSGRVPSATDAGAVGRVPARVRRAIRDRARRRRDRRGGRARPAGRRVGRRVARYADAPGPLPVDRAAPPRSRPRSACATPSACSTDRSARGPRTTRKRRRTARRPTPGRPRPGLTAAAERIAELEQEHRERRSVGVGAARGRAAGVALEQLAELARLTRQNVPAGAVAGASSPRTPRVAGKPTTRSCGRSPRDCQGGPGCG